MIKPIESFLLTKKDPDVLDKFVGHFLYHYEDQRKKLLVAQSCSSQTAVNGITLHLGLDNLPRYVLPEPSFNYLSKLQVDISHKLSEPPGEDPTAYEAGLWLTRRLIMLLVKDFCKLTLSPLVFDKRYHFDRPYRFIVSDCYNLRNFSPYHFKNLLQAHIFPGATTKLSSKANMLLDYADVNQLLQMSSRIFFDTTMASYRLPEVIACSMAFNALLTKFQKEPIEAELAIYRQRWDEMYAAICRFEARDKIFDIDADWKEHISEGIKELGEKTNILLKRSEASAPKKTTRKRYLCSNKLAAEHFGVRDKTIERWRAYYRDPNAKNATIPPAEFPQGYDVTPKQMEYAGKKYRGLID